MVGWRIESCNWKGYITIRYYLKDITVKCICGNGANERTVRLLRCLSVMRYYQLHTFRRLAYTGKLIREATSPSSVSVSMSPYSEPVIDWLNFPFGFNFF